MNEAQLNLFSKGFNQDVGSDKIAEGFYYDALNMRIVTNHGGTKGNLENVLGNLYKIEFPLVSEIYKVTSTDLDPTQVTSLTLTINGTAVTFTSVLETLQSFANIINEDPTFNAMGIKAYTNEGSFSSQEPALFITRLDAGLITTFTITATGCTLVSSLYAASQSGLLPIGWVKMRDSVVLFSTNETSANPLTSLGQIWVLSYDKVTLTTSLSLKYNNYLNFSTAHPIANPGMVVARYENEELQNIYWTDNYNEPRKGNIADPNFYAIEPRFLSTAAIVSPFLPIPQRINPYGGSLKTGIHQVAYRLSKEGGAETAFFLPSYPLWIVEKSELDSPIVQHTYSGSGGSAFFDLTDRGYDGGEPGVTTMGVATSKSITYKIDRLDTNYDRIDIVHIYRATESSTPEINIVAQESFGGTSFTYILTGSDVDIIPISVEEFNSTNQAFVRVGTLDTKDNYLFFGDVTLARLDIDWDARAYRFNASQQARLVTQQGVNNILLDASAGPVTWTDVPEKHDAINPNDEPNSDLNYLYQSDGTTLGGEGPNISYRFITEDMILDSDSNLVGANGDGVPFKTVPSSAESYGLNSTSDVNQVYTSISHTNYLSPYKSGFLRGYQRDEIYRFGIVFYDLNGQPSFTKWIGDIRFPHIWMPTGPNPEDRSIQYELCSGYTSDTTLIGEILGIEFTVTNLDLISDQITGYSIVRAKREPEDRTILGQGGFHPGDYSAGETVTRLVPQGTTLTYADSISAVIGALHSPEFCFPNSKTLTNFASGDKLDVIGVYDADAFALMMNANGGQLTADAAWSVGAGVSVVAKHYRLLANCYSIMDPAAANLGPYTLNAARDTVPWFATGGGSLFTLNGDDVVNHSFEKGDGTDRGSGDGQAGSRCVALHGDLSAFDPGGDDYMDALKDNTETLLRLYLANYKRDLKTGNISTQYTGNSFSQRSKQVYISTNHYQPVTNLSTSEVNKVFGGDTYICIFDKWHYMVDPGSAGTNGTNWKTMLFPVETMLNVEMRQGVTDHQHIEFNMGFIIPNKFFVSEHAEACKVWDEFLINGIFSVENDIRKFYPKPEPYSENLTYDCRIYNNSQPKIDGETFDSWTIFKPDDYLQLNTSHGRISALINHRDRIVFFQDTAFGIYQVNEKAVVPDTQGADLTLGTGGVGERADYVSTVIGSKSKFGFAQSSAFLLFPDIMTKKLYLFSGNEAPICISDRFGFSSYLTRHLKGDVLTVDNPHIGKGITSTFDHKYGEFLISFLDSREDLYDEITGNLLCDTNFDEVVQVTGDELVVDGTFTNNPMTNLVDLNTAGIGNEPNNWVLDLGTPWNNNPGVSMRVNSAVGPGLLWYNLPGLEIGRDYLFSYDMNITAGSFSAEFAGVLTDVLSTVSSATHTHTLTLTSNPDVFSIVFAAQDVAFRGILDNVSVKRITHALTAASCWRSSNPITDPPTDPTWDFKNNKATKITTSTAGSFYQDVSSIITTFPSRWRVRFSVSNYLSGSLTVSLCDQTSASYIGNGTYQVDFDVTAVDTGRITFNADDLFLGSIYNIELVQMGLLEEGYTHNFTVAFDESPDVFNFTTFYSFTPPMYINDKYRIITPRAGSFYMHDLSNYGEFYGTIYPSSVTAIVNPKFPVEKVFDNFVLNTKAYQDLGGYELPIITDERITFDLFSVFNNYQNTGDRPIDATTSRLIKRKWNIAIGGNRLSTTALNIFDTTNMANKAYTERIKSNYIFAKFTYNNLIPNDEVTNYRLVFESLITKYRINPTN